MGSGGGAEGEAQESTHRANVAMRLLSVSADVGCLCSGRTRRSAKPDQCVCPSSWLVEVLLAMSQGRNSFILQQRCEIVRMQGLQAITGSNGIQAGRSELVDSWRSLRRTGQHGLHATERIREARRKRVHVPQVRSSGFRKNYDVDQRRIALEKRYDRKACVECRPLQAQECA